MTMSNDLLVLLNALLVLLNALLVLLIDLFVLLAARSFSAESQGFLKKK